MTSRRPWNRSALRRSCLVAVAVACMTARAFAQNAQDAPPPSPTAVAQIDSSTPLTVHELLQACARAKAEPAGGNLVQDVRMYCRTPYVALRKSDVPSISAIRCVVTLRVLSPADPAAEASGCYAGVGITSSGSVGFPSIGAVQSDLILSATDVFLSRALDAVKQDVMAGFVNRICKAKVSTGPLGATTSVDSVLVLSCAAIGKFAEPDPQTRFNSPLPGVEAIRVAFRQDLLELPGRMEGFVGVYRKQVGAAGWQATDRDDRYVRAVLTLTAVHAIRSLAARQPLPDLLRSLADSLGTGWAGKDQYLHIAAAPELISLTTTIGIASTLDGAWTGSAGALTPSDLVSRSDAVMRTTLVSFKDEHAKGWPMLLREAVVWDDGPPPIINRAQAATVKFLQLMAVAPTFQDLRGATGDQRISMIEQEANLLVPALLDAFGNGTVTPATRTAITRVPSLAAHLAREDYTSVVTDVVAIDAALWPGKESWFQGKAVQALSTAAEVALSQDGDAMRVALSNAIAPPDRYLAKRVDGAARPAVWLNAYVGFAVGGEWLAGQSRSSSSATAAGVALPVGVEWPLNSSASFMVQVFDLGQVANYRIHSTDNTQPDPPALSFKTVFSPGAVLALRPGAFMHRRPYAILLGASYAPSLRQTKSATGTFSPADVVRITAAFAVDVPIVP